MFTTQLTVNLSAQKHVCRLLTLDGSEVQCDVLIVSVLFSKTQYFCIMTRGLVYLCFALCCV